MIGQYDNNTFSKADKNRSEFLMVGEDRKRILFVNGLGMRFSLIGRLYHKLRSLSLK